MTRAEFEAELRREGYEVREGEIQGTAPAEHTEADGVRFVSGRRPAPLDSARR
jgi:hypothetical protein